jgi:hypothetical protein
MNWVSDNWKILFSGVAGTAVVAVIGYLLRQWLKSRQEPGDAELTAQGGKVDRSTVASGSGITQSIGDTHHHHYPAPAPPPQATKQQPASELTPNIEYVGCKEKPVFISPFAREGFCDPRTADEYDNAVQAFILRFENKTLPDRKISRAMNVIAKIRFQSESQGSERRLNYGVWLNSPCITETFGVGDTRELVLMCMVDKQLLAFEDRRTEGHTFYDGFAYIDGGDVEGLRIVEVILIEQKTQATLKRTFKVWRDHSSFCLSETA